MDRRKIAAAAVAAVMLAALATAGCSAKTGTTASSPDKVTVNGSGTALSKPDRAQLDFGVSASDPDPKTAMSKASAAAARLVTALKKAGIAEADLQTTGVTLSPRYKRVGATTRVTGYGADYSLRATTSDLANVGDVISAGTAAGATSVSGPNFTLSDTNPTKYAALGNAVTDARAKAGTLAKAAGRSLGGVLSMTQSGQSGFAQDYRSGAFFASAMPAAVQPGQLEDRASVTVVFALQ